MKTGEVSREKKEGYEKIYHEFGGAVFGNLKPSSHLSIIRMVYGNRFNGQDISALEERQILPIAGKIYKKAVSVHEANAAKTNKKNSELEKELIRTLSELKASGNSIIAESLTERLGIQLESLPDNHYLVKEYIRIIEGLNI
jgi:hypothetical protein